MTDVARIAFAVDRVVEELNRQRNYRQIVITLLDNGGSEVEWRTEPRALLQGEG